MSTLESYLSISGYNIPKKNLTDAQLTKIKTELTVVPFDMTSTKEDIEKAKYKVYKIENDIVSIPRYYGVNNFGIPTNASRHKPEEVNIQFTGKLRDHQVSIVDTCMSHIKSKGGGLLVVPCGFGKTSMAIYMASVLGLKTLVITHKSFLQDQWIDRCKQFTKSEIGIIRRNKVDIDGKDFVIAMVQSMSKRDYDPKIFEKFGTVITDECLIFDEFLVTNVGNIKIGNLFEWWNNKKDLPLIQSFNETTRTFEFKRMTYAWEKQVINLVKITLFNEIYGTTTILCTPNHKFLTFNFSTRTPKDEFICGNLGPMEYVEAQYLGDKTVCVLNIENDKNVLNVSRVINVEHILNSNFVNVYDIEVEDNHNFVLSNSGSVAHNCHHFSAKHFSKALAKAGVKHTIGLSATPYRSDGLMKVTNWYLGEIMFEKRLQINNQVIAKIITFTSTDPLFKEKKRYIKGGFRPDCVKMTNNLVELKCRNDHIINIIDELRRDPARKILILSGRKAHLKLMKESVDKLIDEDIRIGTILKNECRTYYYTGDLKQVERFESEKYADILFATYDMAHEGLDIDRLNTIILATPKKDVVQAVGRILRKVLSDGDMRPLVIDIVDKMSVFVSQSNVREKFYTKSKYIQHYYYISDEKFISPYDYSKLIHQENTDLSKKVSSSYEEMLKVPPVSIEDVSDCTSKEVSNDDKVNKKDEHVEKSEKSEKPKKLKKEKTDTKKEIVGGFMF
jgi:superfamily II DNA or RNA helicase